MESVLTSSWERLSGYNAAAVSPDSHCCGVRETPLAAVITNNPTYRENFHTPRNALPRGRPSPPRNTPSPTKKINSPKHPQPKNALSPPRNTPSPQVYYAFLGELNYYHHPKNTPSPQVYYAFLGELNYYHHPKNTPSPQVPRQRRELQ